MHSNECADQPPSFLVRLRDAQSFFYRREPVLLVVHPYHIALGEFTLPFSSFAVALGLMRNELVLTLRRTVFSIRPTIESEPLWPQISLLLGLRRENPSYQLHEELGRGAFGIVCRATSSDGNTVALKRVSKRHVTAASFAAARKEVRVARQMPPHDNVVDVVEARERRGDFLVVMELVKGGCLLQLLQQRTPGIKVCLHVVRQLLAGVAHLHAVGLVHRDVKLENVLVVDKDEPLPRVKLCDFGLVTEDGELRENVGTGYAQAPEMVFGKQYGKAVDVWACGVVLFVMLYGRLPWGKDRDDKMRAMMQDGEGGGLGAITTEREREFTPKSVWSLLCGLLQPDEKRRLTARAAVEHRAFGGEERVERNLKSLREAAADVISLIRVTDRLRGEKGVVVV